MEFMTNRFDENPLEKVGKETNTSGKEDFELYYEKDLGVRLIILIHK